MLFEYIQTLDSKDEKDDQMLFLKHANVVVQMRMSVTIGNTKSV